MSFLLSTRLDEFFSITSSATATNNLNQNIALEASIKLVHEKLTHLKTINKSLYVIGNGGSAAVAAHATTDFFNVAKLRAFTLHESSLLTCMANDFGYENAISRMLNQCLDSGDILIAISSSGNSMNIQNAVKIGRQMGAFVITFTGFSADNMVRTFGDINFWLDSNDYGLVEIGHQFLLHNIADRFKNITKA